MASTEEYAHYSKWLNSQSTLLHEHRQKEKFDEPCSSETRIHPLLHPGWVWTKEHSVKRYIGDYKSSSEASRHGAYHYIGRPDTPFIALQECPRCADAGMSGWTPSQGHIKTMTVVNPNVALHKKGDHQVLDLRSQLRHYGLTDVAEGHPEELGGWYIYLDQIAKEHIVGHWPWDELKDNERWYEDIVLPAFKAHEKMFRAGLERKADERSSPVLDLDKARLVKTENIELVSDSDEDSNALAKKGLQQEERKRKTICGMTVKIMRSIASTHLFSRKANEVRNKQSKKRRK
ncbi:hypothetical protein BDV06DRAFT_223792 [Aspergillus oleicola]